MLENKYKTTPVFGLIPADKKRFSDCDLFQKELWQYATLKKIKIWWGTARNQKGSQKTLLGIQNTYINLMTNQKKACFNGVNLESSDIIVKEIELDEDDYFNRFYIAFDDYIHHFKIETKKGKAIEFGDTKDKDGDKKIEINDGKIQYLLQCFIGYYNKNQITAIGCKYISKKDYVFIHVIEILRVRHFFKKNEKEKEKWRNKKNLQNIDYQSKALAMLCLLPDAQFTSVIKYLF